jgi:ribosomal-protein-alanine N-acetyltransferase
VPELQRLRADHAPAVLAFEVANRAYFARFISDRGDEFFDRFTEQYSELLAEQEAGSCIFHVLVADDGSVLGLFNLRDVKDGTAELGYRVAEHVAGRGVATATVRKLCRLAAAEYGLHTLRAATNHDNVASQKVLIKAGFVPLGPAEPGGRPGTLYQRELAAGSLSPPGYPGNHPCPTKGAAIQSHNDEDQSMLQRRTPGVRQERQGEAELHWVGPS